MPFVIPDIPAAGNTSQRPGVGVEPVPAQLQRLVDVDRSVAAYGRMIWGFGRGTATSNLVSNPHPTRPLLVFGATWRPLADVMCRVPPLGSGSRNPFDPGATAYRIIGFFQATEDTLQVRITPRNITQGSTMTTTAPTPDVATTPGYYRFEFTLAASEVDPGDLLVLPVEVRNASGTSPVMWSACLVWGELESIDPPSASFIPEDDLFAAYSLRQVTAGAQDCIRVRRLSDNEEEDIGFAGGDLDVAALEAFVGSGDGVIRTWYDQGPNGHHLVCTSNAYRIVTAGSVLADAEGRPFVQMTANTSGAGIPRADVRDTPGVDKAFSRCQWYHVVQRLSSATFVAPLQLDALLTTGSSNLVGGGISNRVSVFSGLSRTDSANNVWMTSDGTWRTLNGHAGTGTDGRMAWLDGSLVVSAGGGGASYNTLRLGDGSSVRYLYREHILYTPAGAYQDSATREAIEADQRAYWID